MTDRTWNSLKGRWEYPPAAALVPAIAALKELTEEQRRDVFAEFCKHCGSDDPSCQCWNDE